MLIHGIDWTECVISRETWFWKWSFQYLQSTESMLNKTSTQLFQIGFWTSLLYEGTYLQTASTKMLLFGQGCIRKTFLLQEANATSILNSKAFSPLPTKSLFQISIYKIFIYFIINFHPQPSLPFFPTLCSDWQIQVTETEKSLNRSISAEFGLSSQKLYT